MVPSHIYTGTWWFQCSTDLPYHRTVLTGEPQGPCTMVTRTRCGPWLRYWAPEQTQSQLEHNNNYVILKNLSIYDNPRVTSLAQHYTIVLPTLSNVFQGDIQYPYPPYNMGIYNKQLIQRIWAESVHTDTWYSHGHVMLKMIVHVMMM